MTGLSIVIPTFNRADLLVLTVLSILDVPWKPLQIVIVDDGSTDNTADRVRDLIAKNADPAIVITYLLQRKQGVNFARNAGVREATGGLIMFVDSDDLVDPDGVAAMASAMETSAVDFVYGNVALIEADGQTPRGGSVGAPYRRTARDLMGYHWHTMAAVYRRSLLERTGLWAEHLVGSDDWELQARIKVKARSCQYLDCTVGYWRQHTGARLGATSFRSSYTRSVVEACRLIGAAAKDAHLLNVELRLRLIVRIYWHWLEFEQHGDREGTRLALRVAGELAGPFWLRWPVSFLIRTVPVAIGGAIVGRRNRFQT